jgi:hypothetical protein
MQITRPNIFTKKYRSIQADNTNRQIKRSEFEVNSSTNHEHNSLSKPTYGYEITHGNKIYRKYSKTFCFFLFKQKRYLSTFFLHDRGLTLYLGVI